MRVRISPAHGYAHGHIEKTLNGIGVRPPVADEFGVVELDLSEVEIQHFQLRGSAHHLERIEETRTPVSASGGESLTPLAETTAPAPGLYTVHYPPTVEEIEMLIGCPREIAEELHRGNELRAQGLTDEQIEEAMRPAPSYPPAQVSPEDAAFLAQTQKTQGDSSEGGNVG